MRITPENYILPTDQKKLDKLKTRFMKFTQRTNNCWEWVGAKLPIGYGLFWHKDKLVIAHRMSYTLFIGPIPEGLTLDHLCRNTSCVNPEHLEAVTHQENVARGNSGKVFADKTHCPKGHPYEGDNLQYQTVKGNPKGGRRCRICHINWTRKYRGQELIH